MYFLKFNLGIEDVFSDLTLYHYVMLYVICMLYVKSHKTHVALPVTLIVNKAAVIAL